jgi:hypothetical protein
LCLRKLKNNQIKTNMYKKLINFFLGCYRCLRDEGIANWRDRVYWSGFVN